MLKKKIKERKKELCLPTFSTTGTWQFHRGYRVLHTIIVHTIFYNKNLTKPNSQKNK